MWIILSEDGSGVFCAADDISSGNCLVYSAVELFGIPADRM
jgi:hypothetical protein